MPAQHTSTTDPELASAPRFSADEETSMLNESNTRKATANALFSKADYSSAISTYDQALASLPNYLDYEVAVLKSNISACHLKLSEWTSAIESASAALDALNRLSPLPEPPSHTKSGTDTDQQPPTTTTTPPPVVELTPADPLTEAAQLHALTLSDTHHTNIARIRSKSLLRRARAHTSLDTWSSLQSASDDYTLLLSSSSSLFPSLPPSDQRTVREALRELGPKIEAAKGREMGEMVGKLKELGNGLLRPFGLSTDMFRVEKGGGEGGNGGYSLSFDQKGGREG